MQEITEEALYRTLLVLLAEGAVIEQIATTPTSYLVRHEGETAPIPAGIIQRLLTGNRIREVCSVNGRKRFYSR